MKIRLDTLSKFFWIDFKSLSFPNHIFVEKRGAKATLQSATELVQSFQSYDNFNEEFSNALCGGNTWKSFQSLNDTATELGRILKGTNDKIALVMKSISCQVYTPIYVKYMHEGNYSLCMNFHSARLTILFLFRFMYQCC